MSHGAPDRAIVLNGLGKRFGSRWVLRGVTLEVECGEAVGLLGANGSGKSTVLRVLATLLKPNAGSGLVNGSDVVRAASAVRGEVGFLAHTPGLYDDLTARENLRFAADMMGLPYAGVEATLDRAGLAHVANDRVRGFSAGMQRRLGIARLILRSPRVLLLDEPYSNLDSEGVDLMNSIVGDIVRSGGAALVALHELAPARAILNRTLTLVEGRVATAGSGQAEREIAAQVPATR
ncbi:MAG TPA: heme ABC exporter ATP-binding protein CcmA [Gemmatimonadaceae bacterium]|nr:heme ABC exporter ATP-binding protein CcmA [Gemmatimonadaceae bacterium]